MGILGTADKVVRKTLQTWSMTQPPGNSAANGTPSLVLTASMMVYFAFLHIKMTYMTLAESLQAIQGLFQCRRCSASGIIK
jgi:hypothetical protein